MRRVLVTYRGNSIELAHGETVVGRDLSCQIRFNDPQISRVHFRLLVSDDVVEVEDAGSSNGTRVNGATLRGRRRVRDGDQIGFGSREVLVQIVSSKEGGFSDEQTDGYGSPNPSIKPRSLPRQPAPPRTRSEQRCPECLSPVTVHDDVCGTCGYSWGDFRPGRATKPRLKIEEIGGRERRQHARYLVHLPIVYQSESLEVEAVAADLSRGGVFIQTQVLEPVGTACTITMLLDGAPAITVRGTVVRTVEKSGPDAAPGMGVRFESLNSEAEAWLDDIIAQAGTPLP